MPGAELRQARQQPERRERYRRRQGHLLRCRLAAQASDRLLDLAQHRPRRCHEHRSGLGQLQGTVPALEQRHAELLFKGLDLPRQG